MAAAKRFHVVFPSPRKRRPHSWGIACVRLTVHVNSIILIADVCDLAPSLRMSCNHVEYETMMDRQAPTLTVWHEGTPIFTSHGNWLHPLFELEDYLAEHSFQPENLILQDKIIGKAAALLILRLGFHTVK